MFLTKELSKLFDKDEWNTSLKVVQKSVEFSLTEKEHTCEIITPYSDNKIGYIECGHVFDLTEMGVSERITNTDAFSKEFEEFCIKIIDKNFKMFRSEYTVNDWFKCFIKEEHGSGVTSLFWLYYNLYVFSLSGIRHFVISNIDGLLHPVSMVQLEKVLKGFKKDIYYKDYKVILLMNNDILFSNWTMEIENLYVMLEDKICNIRNCVDRELSEVHDLQKMLRQGEFTKERKMVNK